MFFPESQVGSEADEGAWGTWGTSDKQGPKFTRWHLREQAPGHVGVSRRVPCCLLPLGVGHENHLRGQGWLLRRACGFSAFAGARTGFLIRARRSRALRQAEVGEAAASLGTRPSSEMGTRCRGFGQLDLALECSPAVDPSAWECVSVSFSMDGFGVTSSRSGEQWRES